MSRCTFPLSPASPKDLMDLQFLVHTGLFKATSASRNARSPGRQELAARVALAARASSRTQEAPRPRSRTGASEARQVTPRLGIGKQSRQVVLQPLDLRAAETGEKLIQYPN